jgi:hypothetical protein
VLAQEDWEVVRFPAIAETDERHLIDTMAGPRIFTRWQGEPLHPARDPLAMFEQIRRVPGFIPGSANTISLTNTSRCPHPWATAWSRPPGSGITRRTSCRRNLTASRRARTPPARQPSSAISVSARAGGCWARSCICSTYCRRMEYPELKRAVRDQYALYRPSVVLIEDKASAPS